MKKRTMSAVMAVMLILLVTVTTFAAERTISRRPGLTINGTTAICTGKCSSGNSSDKISITITLKFGTDTIKSWSASGTGSVVISKTCTVKTGKTYTLILSTKINGITQPSASITANS